MIKAQMSMPLSIIMCDIDHFKKFNDQHGHQAGDLVLQQTASILKNGVPQDAVVARYGGEEFICALPHRGAEAARDIAELIRETIEKFSFSYEGDALCVTVSLGVAEYTHQSTIGREVIRVADQALYKAKHTGRNNVVYTPPNESPASNQNDPHDSSTH